MQVGDHVMMSRYILQRVAEDFGVAVSFAPKVISDWSGSGCHVNYSTKTMREGTQGMEYILNMMKKFGAKHRLHIDIYGEGN